MLIAQPTIDPLKVAAVKKEITEAFREEVKGPLEYMETYNDKQFLFDGDVSYWRNLTVFLIKVHG